MPATDAAVRDAMLLQASACQALGSPTYARLLRELHDILAPAHPLWKALRAASERPVHDAVVLRLLGAAHRLVLSGEAETLATQYPSAGGAATSELLASFVQTIEEHPDAIDDGLRRQVQTNEVGRCAALAPGFALIARRSDQALNILEVGSSAGLNLRWDRYAYRSGQTQCGDQASPLRFTDSWSTPVDLSGEPTVAERRGCDVNPLDAADPQTALTLLSFIWPDHQARFVRLRQALTMAADKPVQIDHADAGRWLAARLFETTNDHATVVFHSIVWQYIAPESQAALRQTMAEHGRRRPLYWLRMEPSGKHADIRLTTWPGGHEEVLGTVGYHGQDVRWVGPGTGAASRRRD